MRHAPLPPELQLRPSAPADLPELAALLSAAHPEQPVALETLERRDTIRRPSDPFERQLVQRGDQLIAMAEVSVPRNEDHPGWLNVEVVTLDPDLAPALLMLAERAAIRLGASTLVSTVAEDWWELPLYLSSGYHEHERIWPSTLDLEALDFGRFTEQEARAQAAVELWPLSSFGDFDVARQRQLHTLTSAIERDVPSTVPMSEWSFETWQHHVLPVLKDLDGLWLAVAPNGDWVGMTGLYQPLPAYPGTLHNGLTGVLPPWRGQSIGLALKLAAVRSALARGYRFARTLNHSQNQPMLAINDQLGFVQEGARVVLVREVS